MKLLIEGDGHFTDKKPERRQDKDFLETMLGKLDQVFQIYRENNCSAMIQVGDFFNSPDASNRVIAALISIIKQNQIVPYVIYGQHDIVGHSGTTFGRSPLKVLKAAGVIEMLGNYTQCVCTDIDEEERSIFLYGASFGQDIPKVDDPKNFNVLVIHAMIGNESLYPGQNITLPQNFSREYKDFNLICCGDYHYYFDIEMGSRRILNPGCLIRKTIGERDLVLEPSVIIYDTKTNETKRVKLKVDPVNEVFDFTEKQKASNDEIVGFVESLRNNVDATTFWQDILEKVYVERKTTDEVKELISESLVFIREEK